jgi:hypothetical protein
LIAPSAPYQIPVTGARLAGALQLNFRRYTAAIRVRQSRIELEAPYHAEPILYRTLGKVRPGRKTLAARSTGRASAAIAARGANAAATSGSI